MPFLFFESESPAKFEQSGSGTKLVFSPYWGVRRTIKNVEGGRGGTGRWVQQNTSVPFWATFRDSGPMSSPSATTNEQSAKKQKTTDCWGILRRPGDKVDVPAMTRFLCGFVVFHVPSCKPQRPRGVLNDTGAIFIFYFCVHAPGGAASMLGSPSSLALLCRHS